jgi:hypothetical protein
MSDHDSYSDCISQRKFKQISYRGPGPAKTRVLYVMAALVGSVNKLPAPLTATTNPVREQSFDCARREHDFFLNNVCQHRFHPHLVPGPARTRVVYPMVARVGSVNCNAIETL